MAPSELLTLYNRCTMMLVTPTKRIVGVSVAASKMVERFLAWVETTGHPLEPYLVSCFAKGAWRYQPKLAELAGKKYEKHYLAHALEAAYWWRAVRDQLGMREPVSAGQEIIKRRMLALGGPDFCRAQPELTGGYLAVSPLCAACPAKGVCSNG